MIIFNDIQKSAPCCDDRQALSHGQERFAKRFGNAGIQLKTKPGCFQPGAFFLRIFVGPAT
jgi:hypothetical protein